LVRRLQGIPGFSIDRVAAAAGDDPDVLRLENLDTDLRPPQAAIEATRRAIELDEDNSYLPFNGRLDLRRAVARQILRRSGHDYDPETEIVITCGGTEGILDALLAMLDPGDEVVLTDPTYAGMIQRVRLAEGVPRLVSLLALPGGWRLDVDALEAATGPHTRALFLMSPSMPSGAVFQAEEWNAMARLCVRRNLWLLYNAAMEAILFDDLRLFHPASLPGLRERAIIVGSVSKEYRMIGWRVGWVVAPAPILADIARVHIYNVVSPTGIAQRGVTAALEAEPEIAASVSEWQRRRDAVLSQLDGWPVIPPQGGWSLLVDTAPLGVDAETASRMLLEKGKVAATPMKHWGGPKTDYLIRLVFSNETVARLSTLRERFESTFGPR
jgi:aspartate/methionine/tyrosine aminotransferase